MTTPKQHAANVLRALRERLSAHCAPPLLEDLEQRIATEVREATEQLQGRVKRLEECLKPFAAIAQSKRYHTIPDYQPVYALMGDCRRAAKELEDRP